MSFNISAAEREVLRKAVLARCSEQLDRMIDGDPQVLLSFKGIELAAVSVGQDVSRLLVEEYVKLHPAAGAAADGCCPKCRRKDKVKPAGEAQRRMVRTTVGEVAFPRCQSRCSRCRIAFFPSG